MAGQIIISNIKTDSDNAFSILANTGAVLFSANLASGITTGIADGSVTNAKLAGSITGDKITVGSLAGNVFTANTITGDKIGQNAISQNNIVSVNASVASVGTLPKARLPSGTVLQVLQTVKTDTFSAQLAQGVFTDVTGLSVSITPTSATSKILCFIDIAVGHSTTSTGAANVRLVRGSTPIYIGDAAGSRAQSIMSFPFIGDATFSIFRYSGVYLDSPATTSSTTYKYQISGQSASYTVYVNRTGYDDNRWEDPRVASSITVMEIAA